MLEIDGNIDMENNSDYDYEMAVVNLFADYFAEIVDIDSGELRQNIRDVLSKELSDSFYVPVRRYSVVISNVYTILKGMNDFDELKSAILSVANNERYYLKRELTFEEAAVMKEEHEEVLVDDSWIVSTDKENTEKLWFLLSKLSDTDETRKILAKVKVLYTEDELLFSESKRVELGYVISNFAYILLGVARNDRFYNFILSFLENVKDTGGKYVNVTL